MELCPRLTRLALSSAALLCSAASAGAFPADNIPYCSSGFEKPAKIVFNSGHMTVTIGEETTKFTGHEPLEGDGIAFVEGDDGEAADETLTDVYSVRLGKEEVILFKDRVFWPCETNAPR